MLMTVSTRYDSEVEFEQVRRLVSHGVGGLMLIGNARPKKPSTSSVRITFRFVQHGVFRASQTTHRLGSIIIRPRTRWESKLFKMATTRLELSVA